MGTALLCLAVAAPAVAGDASAGDETRQPVDRQDAADEGDSDLAQAVSAALDAALGEDGDLADMHLVAGCLQGDSFRTLEIFGRGIGIWNDEAQFAIDADGLRKVLRAVRAADFAHMRKSYGGKHDPDPAVTESESAIKIICYLRLSLGGVEKGVFQLYGGRQYQPLWDLAGELFTTYAAAGETGLRAADLGDGLRKLAAGELAPETFRLIFNRPAQSSAGASWMEESAPTYLLHIEGRTVTSRSYGADGGLGEESSSELEAAALVDLAAVLAEKHVETLPGNLFASSYVDLTVKVLGFDKGIQARRFAGMDRTTHGDVQPRFDKIVATVDELFGRLTEPAR